MLCICIYIMYMSVSMYVMVVSDGLCCVGAVWLPAECRVAVQPPPPQGRAAAARDLPGKSAHAHMTLIHQNGRPDMPSDAHTTLIH